MLRPITPLILLSGSLGSITRNAVNNSRPVATLESVAPLAVGASIASVSSRATSGKLHTNASASPSFKNIDCRRTKSARLAPHCPASSCALLSASDSSIDSSTSTKPGSFALTVLIGYAQNFLALGQHSLRWSLVIPCRSICSAKPHRSIWSGLPSSIVPMRPASLSRSIGLSVGRLFLASTRRSSSPPTIRSPCGIVIPDRSGCATWTPMAPASRLTAETNRSSLSSIGIWILIVLLRTSRRALSSKRSQSRIKSKSVSAARNSSNRRLTRSSKIIGALQTPDIDSSPPQSLQRG